MSERPARGEGPGGEVRSEGVPRPTLAIERRLWKAGHRWVAGLDEVGRGAWAGPVSVGVVVLGSGLRSSSMPTWLRDSKLLAEPRREAVFGEVCAWCVDGAVGHATPAECDRWGMTAALRIASHRALSHLDVHPSVVVVDGPVDLVRFPEGADAPPQDPAALPETVLPVVDADATCAAVAAASVLAKVVRDRLMRDEAVHYPAYGFERNKGYPSYAHRTALQGYGLSAIHRRSWSFVGELMRR